MNNELRIKIYARKDSPGVRKFVLVVVAFTLLLFYPFTLAQAQNLDIGISPPITELVIKPGATYQARYLLSNFSDSDQIFIPQLFTMNAKDEFGTAEIADEPLSVASPYYNWFSINNTPFDRAAIKIRSGLTIEVPVLIAVPQDSQEIDHYFAIVFESDPTLTLGGTGQVAQGGIATNLLISVSETGLPEKNALVEEFKVPKIIDSFFPINYKVRIKNSGNSYFKPIGEIRTTGYFLNSSLNLAPQNILSGTIREIKCLADEELVDCTIDPPFLFGNYNALLSFTLDEEGRKVTKSENTFAFPFSATAVALGIFFLVKKIKKKKKLIGFEP